MLRDFPAPLATGVWYVAKLRFFTEKNRTTLRGKSWRKGEPEPDWQIQYLDRREPVHTNGMIGIRVTATRVSCDNVTVFELD